MTIEQHIKAFEKRFVNDCCFGADYFPEDVIDFFRKVLEQQQAEFIKMLDSVPLIGEVDKMAIEPFYIKGWQEARMAQLNLNFDWSKETKSAITKIKESLK